MKNAYVHFAEGFEEIEAITIVDVLRRAEIPTKMVSVSGKLAVQGAHGITIHTDQLIEDTDFSDAAIMILPGGQPGANNLNSHDDLKKEIKQFYESGKPVAAICAAPIVLGGMKILEGKDVVCYPGYEDKLIGANIKHDLALKTGNIITGRGPGAALNFALKIVSELKNSEKADTMAKAMIVETW